MLRYNKGLVMPETSQPTPLPTPTSACQPLLLQTALDYLPPSPELVLELGCGTGILTGLLRAACPDCALTALDIDPGMLAIAAAKPELEGVRFIAGDLRDRGRESAPM